nr:putative ribonuclease H-like domain-containing protein [Tanacetum cinerariifolium]
MTPRPVNTARRVTTARPRPVNTVRPGPFNTTRPNPAVVNAIRESNTKLLVSPRFKTLLLNLYHAAYGFVWSYISTKDETSGILKKFITEIENLVDKKVKLIRCDNGTEFKNSVMNDFCAMKGIRREFSVARTPQ